jgi:SAM-dependent methyltransferase
VSNVSSHLSELYEDYYRPDAFEDLKRDLAARDSVDQIVRLGGAELGRTLDVGAGEGAVSTEIDRRGLASEIVAVEISQSGIKRILERGLPSLGSAQLFDGYKLPFAEQSFDSAVCAHVIEHVEHERLFLRELARVAKRLYLVAPLEGGARGRIYRGMGHINYYHPLTLLNLIETSGFSIVAHDVFPSSTAYERHISGAAAGTAKSMIRKSLRKLLGYRAAHVMTYVMVVAAVAETSGKAA